MATRPAPRLFVLLFRLFFLIFIQFGSTDQTNIRAEPGQIVTLPCVAERNKHELVIEWSKPDLIENDHVALYRDDQFDHDGQNPAYRNRVDLLGIETKDGDVSLVLKNVAINDTGTYECRVHPRGSNRRKRAYLKDEPICNITLLVSAPGREEEQKKDGGNEEGAINDGGINTGLIAGVLVGVVVLVLLVAGFLLYKKLRRSSQDQNQPPAAGAELKPMNVENH